MLATLRTLVETRAVQIFLVLGLLLVLLIAREDWRDRRDDWRRHGYRGRRR